MHPVTQRQSPTCKYMDPIFMNGSLWPNSAGVVGSLAAWYDSNNTASMLDSGGNPITAGGKVATWKDVSGNSPAGERNLLQGTDARRPVYLPWSGTDYDYAGFTVKRTGLYFDGSNDYLRSVAFTLSQPESVYLVGEQVSYTVDDAFYDGATDVTMLLRQHTSSGQINMYAGTQAGVNSWALQTVAAVCAVFNGASSFNRINRGTGTTPANAGTAAPNGFCLGSKGAAGSPSNIFVSELAIYSVAHATATQDRLALGFSRKWRFTV